MKKKYWFMMNSAPGISAIFAAVMILYSVSILKEAGETRYDTLLIVKMGAVCAVFVEH